MTKRIPALCLSLLTFVFSTPGLARRTLDTWPVKVTGTSSVGTPRASAVQLDLTVTNISTRDQHLTVTVMDQMMGSDVWLFGAAGLSGWSANPNAPATWFQRYDPLPVTSKMLTVPAGQGGSVGWQLVFNYRNAVGMYSYTIDQYPTGTGFTPYNGTSCPSGNCMTGAAMVYKARLHVDIQEDTGALIGALYVRPDMWTDATAKLDSVNMPLNGGRAF